MRHKFIVVLLVLMAAAAASAASCAKAQVKMVLTEDAVHDGLARVDDRVRAFCAAPENAKYQIACADVRTVLLPAIEAGAAFNRAVAAQKVGALAPLVESVGALVGAIKQLPQGQVGDLVVELAGVIGQARLEVK